MALVGKEYGSGSSRDWAAKGTLLLGIRAVIAESYERIHRSNLVGMGVLPLEYVDGQSAASLGLDGRERFTIRGIAGGVAPHQRLTVEATADDGAPDGLRGARAHRLARRRRVPPPRRHPPAGLAAHDRRGLSHHAHMTNVPPVRNEPALTYAPGSPERAEIKRELERLRGEQPEVPLVIGGRERMTNEVRQQREPHLRERVCATWSAAGPAEAAQAIDAALAARHDWSAWSLADRSAVLVRAADLLAGPWRQRVNAATMLGQGKTVREAEIDAAAELADFWRFNVYFAEQIAEQQPISTPGIHNRMEQRGLEGFVYAVTPFNFTAIGGNLPTAPALMGNTVVWKPSQTAILSNWLIFQILREAGLPDGVINFVPGRPRPDHRGLLRSPRVRRRALHRLEPDLPLALPRGRRAHRPLSLLSAPRR